ncbi:hypothetical protein N7490_010682 [Penicillium lividum]|nr:hypothetical protein N7490_010682 [Penicillium lividum]
MQTFALTIHAPDTLTTTTTAESVFIQPTATRTSEASVTAQSIPEASVTAQSTSISTETHYPHHYHWSYTSRQLPSRSCKVCSSVIPSSKATPSSSAIVVPSSLVTTIVSTRTATITACPSATPNCPPSSKTTFVTTETIVVSTTVCPLTGATQTASSPPGGQVSENPEGPEYTTSTIFSIRTDTITACPASVTDCPARLKTNLLTTETIAVSTTVCPITEAAGASQTSSASEFTITGAANQGTGNGGSESTISTIWSTRVATTSYLTTETLAIGTTAYAVSAQPTAPVEGVTATTLIFIADSQAANLNTVTALPKATAGASSGSSGEAGVQDSGSRVAVVYTALYTVESCGNGGSCTEYVNTVVMTQTNVAQTTMTSSMYKPAYGSGVGGVPTASASAHVVAQGSQSALTAGASSTSSAPYAVYTGAASSNLQWPMLQVIGVGMVMLLAILA